MASTIAARKSAHHERIEITTLDAEVFENGLSMPEFIKIDIEGYELPALQGAKQLLATSHPTLYIEMRGETTNEKRRNAKAVLEFLAERGYRSISHVETGQAVGPGNSEVVQRRVTCTPGKNDLHKKLDSSLRLAPRPRRSNEMVR